MKRLSFFFVILYLLHPLQYAIGVEDNGLFKALQDRYKLVFKSRIDAEFFPPAWLQKPVSVTAMEIGDVELRRFPSLLKKALSRYPDGLIMDNLKGIYITKTLYCYGVRYGATYANGVIYITSDGQDQGYSDHYLVGTFHHEFGSILMHNYFFPSAKWLASNPAGVYYRYASDSGYKALMDGNSSLEGNDELYSQGFVNQYAATHIEEDFSEFSAFVFTYPIMMRELAGKYPIIDKKLDVWLEFYRSLDKTMFSRDSLLNPR